MAFTIFIGGGKMQFPIVKLVLGLGLVVACIWGASQIVTPSTPELVRFIIGGLGVTVGLLAAREFVWR